VVGFRRWMVKKQGAATLFFCSDLF